MRYLRTALAAGLLLCGLTESAPAQWRTARFQSSQTAPVTEQRTPTPATIKTAYDPDIARMAGWGLAGGAIGTVGGWWIMKRTAEGLAVAVLGTSAIAAVPLTLGVHLANDSRGIYPLEVLAAAAAGPVAGIAANGIGANAVGGIAAIVAAELGAAILVEVATSG